MYKIYFILLLFFSSTVYSHEKRTIFFTPLPMEQTKDTVETFLPLINYLKNDLSINIKFNNKKNYKDIIKGFENKTIDMAFLGPLPYVILKNKYPHIKPIVSFKQKNGSTRYRCVLSKFITDNINKSKPVKIALTQPLSTCGYFMSKILLKKTYNINLKNQYYNYTMSHTNALMGALKGKYDLAGSTEMVAEKFKTVGMQIVAKSIPLPGFCMVVNTKTLSKKEINNITKSLLKISTSKFKTWGGKIKYGVLKTDKNAYNDLKINYIIPQKGNML